MTAGRPKVNIILDSGAFSAWKLNKEINLQNYCAYIKENEEWITTYINLDRINPADPEAAAAESFRNLKRMRKMGLNPMPVYHIGEDISWLQRMLDLGCDYIGIGALSLRASDRADRFYDYAWSHMVNGSGLPLVKVHGLGEGRRKQLKTFPWYSSDSTSWIYTAQRTGRLMLPDGSSLSQRNDGKSSRSAADLAGLSGNDLIEWQAIMEQFNIDPDMFHSGDQITAKIARTYLTGCYYKKLQSDVRALHPIRYSKQNLLNANVSDDGEHPFKRFNLHLVIGTNDLAFAAVAKLKHRYVLISYYMLAGLDPIRESIHAHLRTSLKQFCMEPIKAMSAHPRWTRYWDVLERYIK